MTFLRQRLKYVLLGAVLAIVGAYALASWDWCGEWIVSAPQLLTSGRADGTLHVGGAREELLPPNAVRAGYGPLRPDATHVAEPLHARALVFEAGEEKLALASVDTLTLPAAITARVREELTSLGFDSIHLFATHTHSGFGGYDARVVSELAGTGLYSEEAEATIVNALVRTITAAHQQRLEATLHVSLAEGDVGIGLRSEGEGPDGRLHLLQLETAKGAHAVVLFAAHPTLQARDSSELDPDFPARVSALLEAKGGTALFLQGAVGNTVVTLNEGAPQERMQRFAKSIVEAAEAAPSERIEPTVLGHARVQVSLPRPDSSRLVPSFASGAGDNLLCHSAPKSIEISAIALGPLKLLIVPAEVTEAAGRALETQTGAARVLSLGDGYVGYLEVPDRVKRQTGEARRQYFGPTLLETIGRGGAMAIEAMNQTSIFGSSGSGR